MSRLSLPLACAMLAGSVAAQDDEPEELPTLADIFSPEMINDLAVNASALLPDLVRIAPDSSIAQLLKGLNIRAKTFEDENGTARVGFSYDFSKSLLSPTTPKNNTFDYAVSFEGRGNVSLDSTFNPNDFLETGLRVSFFKHSFDAKTDQPVDSAVQERAQAIFQRIADEDLDPSAYRDQPEWQFIKDNVRDILGLETLIDFSGHATLESDQEFNNYQYAYGANVGLVLKEWDDEAPLSRLNVFDYPFALLRVLTGEDENFTPSGRAWPILTAGIDLVDPTQDQLRSTLMETNTYARFRTELSMRSLIAHFNDEPVYASIDWRYYREIDASTAIRAVNREQYSYFAARLDLPNGLYVGFATGQLPFDVTDSSLAEVGFRFKL